MAITINIRYKGQNGSAVAFAKEMTETGTVEKIRNEEGNLRYEYYRSLEDPETILLIDSWKDQEAIDRHHSSEMMKTISDLRNRYDLHMEVDRFTSLDNPEADDRFIRK